jgi:hypothetical protein
MGESHSLKTMNSHNLEEHTTIYLLVFGLSNKDIWMIYNYTYAIMHSLTVRSTNFRRIPSPGDWALMSVALARADQWKVLEGQIHY